MTSLIMRRVRDAGISLLPLACGVILLACADDAQSASPTLPPLTLTGSGIHPVLVITSQSADSATMELHLKRVDVAEKVASFQGELSYDRATLTLATASIPAGITGAWHEVRPGVVRFTGVSVEGMTGSAVLEMRFGSRAPVGANAVTLKMEELVAAESFARLESQLQQQGAQLLISNVRP